MKRLLQLGCLLAVVGVFVLVSQPASPGQAEKAAIKLFKSLTPEQKKLALKPFNSEDRYREIFPPVERPGLPFTMLTAEQKELVNEAIRAVTSDYGTERILTLAKQGKAPRRYLNFFGDPTRDKKFAWRMAQHHLTLIYAEFGNENPREFGPILLGGNPVKTLWDAEDQIFLKLYASLTDEERAQVGKKGKKSKGIRIGDLNPKAKTLAHQLLKQRVAVFSDSYRDIFDDQLQRDGGIDNLYLAINAKDASKSHHEGGRYDWQIAGQHVFCNWNTRGNEHIHMTLRASPAKKAG